MSHYHTIMKKLKYISFSPGRVLWIEGQMNVVTTWEEQTIQWN